MGEDSKLSWSLVLFFYGETISKVFSRFHHLFTFLIITECFSSHMLVVTVHLYVQPVLLMMASLENSPGACTSPVA